MVHNVAVPGVCMVYASPFACICYPRFDGPLHACISHLHVRTLCELLLYHPRVCMMDPRGTACFRGTCRKDRLHHALASSCNLVLLLDHWRGARGTSLRAWNLYLQAVCLRSCNVCRAMTVYAFCHKYKLFGLDWYPACYSHQSCLQFSSECCWDEGEIGHCRSQSMSWQGTLFRNLCQSC
jgi:hypothetical protein